MNAIITISPKKYKFGAYTARLNASAAEVINSPEIIFNDKLLTIRLPIYSDNKRWKLTKRNDHSFAFGLTSMQEGIHGKYLLEQEQDIYYLTKITNS